MSNPVESFIRGALGTYFPWILYLGAVATTFYLISEGVSAWAAFLQALVLFMGGFQGLWAASAHLLFPESTAKQIGWLSNPFQTEMGFTNLALGITGVLSWFYSSWQVPVGLTVAIIFTGCAYVHIKDLKEKQNKAPCNSGPMLYSTIITFVSLYIAIVKLGLVSSL